MKIQTNLLKPHAMNGELFGQSFNKETYEGLKNDIQEHGIKVDLHILPDKTILCGHQRWTIAKELGLKEVPVKIVKLKEEDVREYIIKDNLLRRQLDNQQRRELHYHISILPKYKSNPGERTDIEPRDTVSRGRPEERIAEELYGDKSKWKTIQRDIKTQKIVKEKPELSTKSSNQILKEEVREYKEEINLNRINPYDQNMFHFSIDYGKSFDKGVICVDITHGENDIRQYKDFYPTVLHVCTFIDMLGKEFSLRDYADIQDFPRDYKFVGTSNEIKRQIGEAVSPKMGEYIIKKYIKGKNYIELFCGCGGFSVAAHKLKKKCLWSNDFNKYSGYSFKLNFPEVDVCIKDIRKISEKEIHEKVLDVDFILGGPPCQGFSIAGKRLGFKEDNRNNLYLEYLKFVKEFQPKQFIMENVKEILNYKDEIIKDFEDIGYKIIIEKVNGLDIGMKQKRIRVFFIGYKK